MYREDYWAEGNYIDNHKKYECLDCERQFIVGEKGLEECPPGFPVCPYCGQNNVICIAETDDDMLEEFSDNMGCLAIRIEIEAKE